MVKHVLSFFPLNFSVTQQSPNVLSWVKSLFREDTMPLTLDELLSTGQRLVNQDLSFTFTKKLREKFIWATPPGAAYFSIISRLDQLEEPNSCGVLFFLNDLSQLGESLFTN